MTYGKMKYDKLVRDKIPEIIKKSGITPVIHTASDVEYCSKLKKKLHEEVGELERCDPVCIAEELADVLEVIYAISDYYGVDKKELERIRQEKAITRGSFKERIILDEVK